MRFLLRLGFWLTVILVCLPSGGSQSPSKVNISAGEAISAATAAMSDVKQFCGRQSDACVVGSQVATVLGQRAQAGAKFLYEFLNEHVGAGETGTTAEPGTKAVPVPAPRFVVETRSIRLRLRIVGSSRLLGFGPRWVVEKWAARHPLAVLPVRELTIPRPVGALYRKDAYLPSCARRLIELFGTTASRTLASRS
jgi:DNA-binding transcriptional LysR family regulator